MGKLSAEGDNIELVANAIRSKGGTSSTIKFPTGFVSAIENMSLVSKCVSGTFSSGGSKSVTLSISGMTKIHSISIWISGNKNSSSDLVLDMLTVIMSDDGRTVEAGCECSSTYMHYTDCYVEPMAAGGANSIEFDDEASTIKITPIWSDFNATYTYYIYGS